MHAIITFCLGVLLDALSSSLHVVDEHLSQSPSNVWPRFHPSQREYAEVGQGQLEGAEALVKTRDKPISDLITGVLYSSETWPV